MKRLLSVSALALSIFTTSAAFAQMSAPGAPTQQSAPTKHAHNPHRMAMRLGKQLNLSPDQTAKIEPILADRQQKVLALREDTSLTEDQRKQQMKAVRVATKQQMAGILSPDQMRQLKHMRREKSGKAKG